MLSAINLLIPVNQVPHGGTSGGEEQFEIKKRVDKVLLRLAVGDRVLGQPTEPTITQYFI